MLQGNPESRNYSREDVNYNYLPLYTINKCNIKY